MSLMTEESSGPSGHRINTLLPTINNSVVGFAEAEFRVRQPDEALRWGVTRVHSDALPLKQQSKKEPRQFSG